MARMHALLAACRTIVTDDDVDRVERLLHPEDYADKSTLGTDLTDAFGYNPIEYHDKRYLEASYDEIVSKAPESMRSTLVSMKESTIDEVLRHKTDTDEEYLYQLLIAQISSNTGWTCKSEVVDLNAAIYDEICGVGYGDDDGLDDEPVVEDDEDPETISDDDDDYQSLLDD